MYNPEKIKKIILLGVSGDNLSSSIDFDMKSWAKRWPNAGYVIILQRPGEFIPFNVSTVYNPETKILTWNVTSNDTAIEGDGQAEIICTEGNVIKKSSIFDVEIEPCLNTSGPVPDPLENWYERMIQVEVRTKEYRDESEQFKDEAQESAYDALQHKNDAEVSAQDADSSANDAVGYRNEALQFRNNAEDFKNQAAQSASEIEDLTVSVHSLPTGSTPTVTKTKEEGEPYNLDFGIPIIEDVSADIIVENNNRKFVTASEKQQISTNADDISDIQNALNDKVDKVSDKGLSTNDYDDTEKSNVANNTSARHTHTNKSILDAIEVAYTQSKDNKLMVSTQVQDNHIILNGTILIDGVATTVYDDTEIRQAIAKMEVGWVIDTKSQITGTEDSLGNFTNVTVITGLDLSLIKVGDNIYVKDNVTPDYWVSGKNNNVLSLNVLDTKTDLSNYYNKTEVNSLLGNKVDKVSGKDLSTNDYDNAEKQKVADATNHISNTNNPHNVTKSQVGLGNVDNTSDLNKPISTATQNALDEKVDKSSDEDIYGVKKFHDGIETSSVNTDSELNIGGYEGTDVGKENSNTRITGYRVILEDNGGGIEDGDGNAILKAGDVTKSSLGLDNVDNTSDLSKPISTATLNALNLKADDNNVVHKTGTDVIDESLYLFRTTGQNKSVVDRVKIPKITGGSVAFNQLINPNDISGTYTTRGVTFTNNGDGSITLNGRGSGVASYIIWTSDAGIVGPRAIIYFGCMIKNYNQDDLGSRLSIALSGGGAGVSLLPEGMLRVEDSSNVSPLAIQIRTQNTQLSNVTFKPFVINLTQMFGSTIAKALYNAGNSGVALFKSLFPDEYYPYNAGELMSVDINSKKVVGVNQWDEEWEVGNINSSGQPEPDNDRIRSKNYISCFSNKEYFCNLGSKAVIYFYDYNYNLIPYTGSSAYLNGFNGNVAFTTPIGTKYMKFRTSGYGTTYNHDIQIALYWSGGSIPTTYHPYETYTYNMNGGVLRGIPKIADGKIYYDGDEYTSDGKIKRKYGIVDLGSLDYSVGTNSRFIAIITDIKPTPNNDTLISVIMSSSKYALKTGNGYNTENYSYYIGIDRKIGIKDIDYSDVAAFKAAMSGVYLVYELATPTEENAPAYQETQYVNDWGTEEFITNNNSIISIQAYAIYLSNLYDKLNNLPENGISNSYNVVYQNGSKQELVDVKTLKYVHVYELSYDDISYEIWHMSKSPTLFNSALELYNDMTRKDGIFLNRKITSTANKSAGLYVLPRNSGKVNFWYYKNGVLEAIADVVPTSFSAINVYSFIDFNADI